jgi:hypothetical protein
MRNWLVAKAEEDKRKQEEEKTRQESYRLEQRRVEQSMLREAIQAGVPPQMVPMIYAGIGGSNLANVSIDWLQQYATQLQAAQQQLQQQAASPDIRRDSRMIGQGPATYAPQPAAQSQVVPTQAIEPAPTNAPLQTTFNAYQPAPPRGPQSAVPRSAAHTQLPRLTTNEMYVHQPPTSNNPGSAHPLQQSQSLSDQPSSSPLIYFHHWVPPNESKSNNQQPQTPASKGGGEPLSAHPGSSHMSEDGYKESPRKRKAQGSHQPAPPPSSTPQYTSPSFSSSTSVGRKNHARTRSNASAKEMESKADVGRDIGDPPRSSQQQPEYAERRQEPLQVVDERPRSRPMDVVPPDIRREER